MATTLKGKRWHNISIYNIKLNAQYQPIDNLWQSVMRILISHF